jgi:hypothetical protein
MGSVKKISTGAWQTRWRDPRGDQRAKNFDRKAPDPLEPALCVGLES